MYNRYVPQPDGSFRRTRLPDRGRPMPPRPTPESCPPPAPEPCPIPQPCPTPEPSPPPKQKPCPPPKPEPRSCRPPQQTSISGFFRQLLPKDMDTGDLLIILLLLLMAGDCQEDQNSALLTLVLYLFM